MVRMGDWLRTAFRRKSGATPRIRERPNIRTSERGHP